MNYQPTLNFSNTMTNILLEGVKETIDLTEKPFSINNNSVEDLDNQRRLISLLLKAPLFYGERGASGIAHRIGEASFRYFIRRQGKEYSLSDNSYRLMNSSHRIVFGLSQIAAFMNKNCGLKVEILEDEKRWYWKIVSCGAAINWNRIYTAYMMGLLREYFLWTSGGRFYQMEEMIEFLDTETLLQIGILKKPLDN